PATLVTTADTDDRVVPGHSFKFIAQLQYCQAGPAPVLARIETRAGHGAGKPTAKLIEEVADQWAFLVKNLNMKLPAGEEKNSRKTPQKQRRQRRKETRIQTGAPVTRSVHPRSIIFFLVFLCVLAALREVLVPHRQLDSPPSLGTAAGRRVQTAQCCPGVFEVGLGRLPL